MKEIMTQLKKLDKLDTIEKKLDTVDLKVSNLDLKLIALEKKVNGMDERVKIVEADVELLSKAEKEYKMAMRKCEIAQIIAEENTRKYNIVIDNLPMSGKYEEKDVSVQKVHSVLSNVLKIPNANNIVIADAHRLYKESGRKPLIFKLAKMTDKNKIWDHLRTLQAYNHDHNPDAKVYLNMNNLPAKLARDRKELLDDYKLARDDNRKPKWRFVKNVQDNICEYCFKVGDTLYRPKSDNFTFKLNV